LEEPDDGEKTQYDQESPINVLIHARGNSPYYPEEERGRLNEIRHKEGPETHGQAQQEEQGKHPGSKSLEPGHKA
jgi:hypothetical protein